MTERATVPCAGCRACCKREIVVIVPEDGDDPALYDTETVELPGGRTAQILRHKPNGDCVHLGPDGCSIWDRAPTMCRVFDCRRFFQHFTRQERKRMPGSQEVFVAARKLLTQERTR